MIHSIINGGHITPKTNCMSTHSVDNSEWMRNGDFVPSRLQVQEDAANSVTLMKTRQNVENSVGLLTLAE